MCERITGSCPVLLTVGLKEKSKQNFVEERGNKILKGSKGDLTYYFLVLFDQDM